MKTSGSVFVVSGPSGAGKSTIIRLVREAVPDLAYSISHTSRKPRGSEVDGVDYHFVSKEAFRGMMDAGGFAEWAEVYGDFYGTSLASLQGPTSQGLDVILDVDTRGASNIKARIKECILIYVLPPSLEELKERLRSRGTDSEEAVRVRLEKASEEIKNCAWYDYLIFNGDLAGAVDAMKSLVVSERCRRFRQLPRAREAFHLHLP